MPPLRSYSPEISCGDLGIEGVKVQVSPDRFEALITRMESFETGKITDKWSLHSFLAHRCDFNFLSLYISRHPEFISALQVGSYLSVVSEMSVLIRLKEFGLLPEGKRQAVVHQIRELAVATPDAGFLRARIRQFLTTGELAEILEHVRTELLPRVDETIAVWRSNFGEKDDPEQYFEDLVYALNRYRDEMEEDPEAVNQIDSALSTIKDVIEELQAGMQQEPDSDDFRGGVSSGIENDGSRSIFDDVDQ